MFDSLIKDGIQMNKSNFLSGILMAAIGLILLLDPETSIKAVVVFTGAFSVVKGIYDLILSRSLNAKSQVRRAVLIQSIIGILTGLFAIILPLAIFNTIQTIVRIMLYILAVYLVLSAFICFYMTFKMNSDGGNKAITKSFISEGLTCMAAAVILFLLPQNFGVVVVRVLGIIVILTGICMLLYTWKKQPLVIQPDSVEDIEEPSNE